MASVRGDSPAETLYDEDIQKANDALDFAHLIPINRRAQQAFEEVASRIAGDDNWQLHARQFVVCADVSASDDMLHVNHYRLCLSVPPSPAHRESGWYVGSGYADKPDRVDLLLTAQPQAYDVGRRHLRLYHDPQSSFRLTLETRGEVVVNGQEMIQGGTKRVVDQILGLGVGDLQYCLRFTNYGLSQRYADHFFAKVGVPANIDPPRDLLNLSPAPYTIGSYRVHAANAGGSTSTVSQGYHITTGQSVAVKRIRRTKHNWHQVSNEMVYLEQLKHVSQPYY